MNRETLERIKAKVSLLPLKPGVYFMKDVSGKIIYVGKAKALKNRVSQYFMAIAQHPPKVQAMVAQVYDFDYITTGSEMEALVLECSEIKHHKPRYNILLKDDKAYPYVKIPAGPFPRVTLTRKRESDGGKYFGPYTGNVKGLIAEVNKTFSLPTCTRAFPQEFGKARPCLNYFINTCSGLCRGEVTKEEYAATLTAVEAFLGGKYEDALKDLERQMEEASERLEFEKAAKLRDRLFAVRRLTENQKVLFAPDIHIDALGFYADGFSASVNLLVIRAGRLISKLAFEFADADFGDRAAGMASFLKQFYAARTDIPKQVLLPFECEDAELIADYLSEQAGKKVELKVPQRGQYRDIIRMANDNALETVRLHRRKDERRQKTLALLQEALGLENPPKRIEAIDISNTGGAENVAAIVSFVDGEKYKDGIRKYKIKSFAGQDDYESMREVIWRRMKRYQNGDSGFEELPDLLLVDGGLGQISAVNGVLKELDIRMPVFGMVKDDKHKTRGVLGENGEVSLKMGSPAFTLIASIQEEVHRQAVGFHKQRSSDRLKTGLEEVPGLGKIRIRNLMRTFKSMSKLKEATLDELLMVDGMNRTAAEQLLRFFGKEA